MLESRKNTEQHICTALFNSQAVIFQEYFLNLWGLIKNNISPWEFLTETRVAIKAKELR